MGQLDRRRQRAATPTTRCRARSRTSPTSTRPTATSLQAGFYDARPAGARRLALGVRLATERQGGRARAPSRPTRCRRSSGPTTSRTATTATGCRTPRSRSPGFDRIIGIEEAERTTADAARPDPGRGPPRRDRRPARQPLQPQAAPAGRARQPPVRSASCGATASSSICESAPGGFLLGSSRPGGRERRLRAAAAAGTCTTTSTRTARSCSGASRPRSSNDFTTLPDRPPGRHRAGQRDDLHDAVLGRRPGPHAERPEHGEPARPAARSPTRSPTSRAPASRSTRRCAGTSTRSAAARRSRSTAAPAASASSTRSTSAGIPDKDGYGDVQHGSSFIMAAQFVDGKCPVRAGTFVTYSQSENQGSQHAGDYTRAFSKSAGTASRSAAARSGARRSRRDASPSAASLELVNLAGPRTFCPWYEEG